jgi:hypothetical protein
MIFMNITFLRKKLKVIAALVNIPGVDVATGTCFDFSREGNSVAGIDTVDVQGLGLSLVVPISG